MLNYKILSLIAVIFSLTTSFASDDDVKCDCGLFQSIKNCLFPKKNSFELEMENQNLSLEFCFRNQKITNEVVSSLIDQMSIEQNKAFKIVSLNNCTIEEKINWKKYWPNLEIIKFVYEKAPSEIRFDELLNVPSASFVFESKTENPQKTTSLRQLNSLHQTPVVNLFFLRLSLSDDDISDLKNSCFSIVENIAGSILFERKKKKIE